MDAEFILVRRSLEQSIKELPPLPTAVLRVLEIVGSADPDVSDLEEVVGADQALTAKMLRVVNSAYYGLARQISNVGQAVVILGMQQVRNVTLAVGASSTFKPANPRQAAMMNEFWTHSFATSSSAVLLAGQKGLPRREAEEIGTCGLIADIGRLFLFANFPKTFDRLIKVAGEGGVSFAQAEREILGTPHAELGGTIAERWGLPSRMVETIERHEGPWGAGASDAARIVHMADLLNEGEYRMFEGLAAPPLDPSVAAYFAYSDEDWAAVRERTGIMLVEASQAMGVMAA